MHKDAQLISVFGRRGSGKSTGTKALIRQASPSKLIVLDVVGEYEGGGWTICYTLADVLKCMKVRWHDRFKISYRPAHSDHVANLHNLMGLCFKVQEPYRDNQDTRKLMVVIEEADLSIPNHNLPTNRRNMQKAVLQGRHWGIEAIAVSQRPALVSKHYRGNVSCSYVFALSEHDDRAEIGKVIGRQHVDMLTSMANYSFLKIENGQFERGKTTKSGRLSYVRTG